MTPLVLALSGTDHHPFDRLVSWMDDAAGRHPDVRFVVQHGATRPPRLAEGHDFLGHDRLAELLGEATVVVCHGGPGTIMDAREAGHLPLCVPRDPSLGEHVDGHQQRFAAVAADSGVVRAIGTAAQLHDELSYALARGPRSSGDVLLSRGRDAARQLVAAELDRLMAPTRVPRRARWGFPVLARTSNR